MVNHDICGDVEFWFFRPEAKQIFLVGDFNGWHKSAFPMMPREGG